MAPTLRDLERLARQTGVILRMGFGRRQKVEHKSHWIDLVTETDREAEEFLVREIRRLFPDHAVMAEETGNHGNLQGPRWYVDPLDGTVNFAHGMPIFSVSLAFADEQGARLGVVYDPMRDELFAGERGRGAWLNGRPLRVSHTQRLADALLITGFPYDAWNNPDNNVDNFARFLVRTQGVLRLGSAALDICYVAAGRADGFWELRLKPWDVAAASLIAREAGATVTDPWGRPLRLEAPVSVLVANPTLHRAMLRVLRGQEEASDNGPVETGKGA